MLGGKSDEALKLLLHHAGSNISVIPSEAEGSRGVIFKLPLPSLDWTLGMT